MISKTEARKMALISRKGMNQKEVSSRVIERIKASQILESFHNIGIYYPIGLEINVMPLVEEYPNISFYLPVTKEKLSFVKYELGDLLQSGPFHTLEPTGISAERDSIEAFIIPCVGITKNNKRIGYGKGYYDRYLEGYKGLKIGICYENSINLDVECNEHDIILDYKFSG